MIDATRTYLARYESHLLCELQTARREQRLAARRVEELETEVAGVRDALSQHHESRAREPEAVPPDKEKVSCVV